MATIRSGASSSELIIDPTSFAARVTLYDSTGALLGTSRATYHATARLASTGGLVFTFTSATSKQFMTLHHTSASTKTVKILKAWLSIISCDVATKIIAELVSISTAPATGNPAITPMPLSRASAAADSTCLALPTTAGTEVSTTTGVGGVGIVFTAVSAQTAVNPQGIPTYLFQYNPLSPSEVPVIRAGVTEGWAIRLFPNATTPALTVVCGMEFTEE